MSAEEDNAEGCAGCGCFIVLFLIFIVAILGLTGCIKHLWHWTFN